MVEADPSFLARLPAGFAVMGDAQFLPGYSLLIPDDSEATRLSDLPRAIRLAYLGSLEHLAEAVELACKEADPAFRRVNIEILGNSDPHLHAHCFVLNGSYDDQEKRWKAIQVGDLKADAPYFEARFLARLGQKLRGHGEERDRDEHAITHGGVGWAHFGQHG